VLVYIDKHIYSSSSPVMLSSTETLPCDPSRDGLRDLLPRIGGGRGALGFRERSSGGERMVTERWWRSQEGAGTATAPDYRVRVLGRGWRISCCRSYKRFRGRREDRRRGGTVVRAPL
jgi:hypothetical protein